MNKLTVWCRWAHQHQVQIMEELKNSDDGFEIERALPALLLGLAHPSLAALSIDSAAAPCQLPNI